MDKVYLQLYSLGKEMQDIRTALEKVGKIGYTGVEFAGSFYGGMTAKELKPLLADNGLEALSAHVMPEAVEQDVELLAELGAKYMVAPMIMFADRDSTLRVAEVLNQKGELCKKNGIRYGYHNHTQEFIKADDTYLLDILMDNTDPDLVFFQLDVGWCTAAGLDAPEYIRQHAGRIGLIHVKEAGQVIGSEPFLDFSKIERDESGRPIFTEEMLRKMDEVKRTNVPMGRGLVNWPVVRTVAEAQGAQAFIVEREWDYADDIYTCIQEDLAYLRSI